MKPLVLSFVASVPGPSMLPPCGLPEICLAGRSNVGKSSIVNRLSTGNPARTSQRPGCTRMFNLYRALEGFVLVDLPGYGYAEAPVEDRRRWPVWIGEYLSTRRELAGVVLVVDARHPALDSDAGAAQALRESGREFLVVLNKSDKMGRARLAGSLASAGSLGPVIAVSCRTGEGMDPLRRWILRTALGKGEGPR
ncbi:ribosome biogenesis GTP-binding protein YsxC [Candidatus Fermentibacteria bacterium]|nr:ribosome biogenesis GTP-binding protein YsxC [Candidatus Fermentibacteria bacterium]